MAADDTLGARFDGERTRLRSVALRMLGSESEADDAVQEAWLRVSRGGVDGVDNLSGWLTTVVSRICLDMLRARSSRAEEPLDDGPEPAAEIGADQELLLADSVGPALLVVLQTLAPAERVAFVLHDMFAVSFEEIAQILGRTPASARQLASRARRRVQGGTPGAVDRERQRAVVAAFFTASRLGDFDALLAVLDPDVVVHADATAVRLGGGTPEMRGAHAVATTFRGRARTVQVALLDGEPGGVVMKKGALFLAFRFTLRGERVAVLDVIAEPAELAKLHVQTLG